MPYPELFGMNNEKHKERKIEQMSPVEDLGKHIDRYRRWA